jgi:hypothetical protein
MDGEEEGEARGRVRGMSPNSTILAPSLLDGYFQKAI